MKKEVDKDKRKTRSDKKREIRPVVSIELYECLNRISYITIRPIKDVGERLCIEGLKNEHVIETLSPFFRRDYRFDHPLDIKIFVGKRDQEPMKYNRGDGTRGRPSLRFLPPVYDQICDLAYSLDHTPSTAAAILMETTLKETEFITEYLQDYIIDSLDASRYAQLKEIVKYLNDDPGSNSLSMAQILDYIVNKCMKQGESARKIIEEFKNWIDRYTP